MRGGMKYTVTTYQKHLRVEGSKTPAHSSTPVMSHQVEPEKWGADSTFIWPRDQTYTVASAPTVTGKVFVVRCRLFV